MRNMIPCETGIQYRQSKHSLFVYTEYKSHERFQSTSSLVFEKIEGCIFCLYSCRIISGNVRYWMLCIMKATFHWIKACTHTHSLINHITGSMQHIGKRHEASSKQHTHVQSLFIVFALSCDCHVQWLGQKSFSSLLNNHLIIVNSLNRISIDRENMTLTESDENICSFVMFFHSFHFHLVLCLIDTHIPSLRLLFISHFSTSDSLDRSASWNCYINVKHHSHQLWLPVFICIHNARCVVESLFPLSMRCIDNSPYLCVLLLLLLLFKFPCHWNLCRTKLYWHLNHTLLIPNELTLIDMCIMKLTKIGFHMMRADGVRITSQYHHAIPYYSWWCSSIWNHYNPYTFTWLCHNFHPMHFVRSYSCSYLIARMCSMHDNIWCNWNFNCNRRMVEM